MATLDIDDTIVAIASAPGPGMRGIVRVSGPGTIACLERGFIPDDGRSLTEYRTATSIAGQMRLGTGSALSGVLLLWPTDQSYTRQPTAEFHSIGSMPLLQMLLAELCKSNARLAEPGEFTLRAFLSGRIDLTQAEAVLAVIDSTGARQFETALQQLAGGLAGPLGSIRDDLIGTLAELEAGLDFVEEDIEFISETELTSQLVAVQQQLDSIIQQIKTRNLAADSVKVVLSGQPNSGKSSLFNALAESNQAIVTDVAGTTTDFVSAKLVFNSASIELIDTAGFEESSEPVAQQAQVHRTNQLDIAHVQVFCLDSSHEPNRWDMDQLSQADDTTIVVLTKCDLLQSDAECHQRRKQIRSAEFHGTVVETSSVDGTGLARLRDEIGILIVESLNPDHSVVSSTVLRASESLLETTDAVQRALIATRERVGEEIVAAEIRLALEGLGQVVGTVYTDDILDLVFGRFCIGK